MNSDRFCQQLCMVQVAHKSYVWCMLLAIVSADFHTHTHTHTRPTEE